MNDKKQKKPMPEYWYEGKAIKNEKALVKALVKDGKIDVKKNVTLYEYHEDVRDMVESAFDWDLAKALDAIQVTVDGLDEGDDICGIKSIDYKEGESVTINGRKYTWSGALRKLVKLGVVKILAHKTVYHAYDDDYWYMDTDEPLEFLLRTNAYKNFAEHLESLNDEEFEKAREVYGI